MSAAASEVPAGRHPALDTQLGDGELRITGRLTQASNATFLAELTTAEGVIQCVYKPIAGERPLWDFPENTLAMREVGAYRLSAAAGFDLVPVTVLVDGPVGTGSLQVWVDTDQTETDALVDLVPADQLPRDGYFEIVDGIDGADRAVTVVHADHPRLRRMATFDALINNADRKGGHILGSRGSVFGVDHGVTFNVDPKLRTLLWGWAGEPLEDEDVACVERAVECATDVLGDLLAQDEIVALIGRADRLLRKGRLPWPSHERHTIPWPPF